MPYLYDKINPDWVYGDKYKGGWTKNPVRRKEDGHSEHSHLSKYNNLYEVNKKEGYKLGNKLPDRIIFDYGRSLQQIETLEEMYECELPYLREIGPYLVEHNGSDEFIHNNGRELYEKIILEDFPKLRLKTKKLSSGEVDIINQQRVEYVQSEKNKANKDSLHELLKLKEEERKKKVKRDKQSIKDEYEWFERQYQTITIEEGINKLSELYIAINCNIALRVHI